jgi:hypothetical protein
MHGLKCHQHLYRHHRLVNLGRYRKERLQKRFFREQESLEQLPMTRQRRYYDPATGQMSKTNQHVDFPEVLDLSPYCAYGGGKEGMPSWAGRGSGSGISGGEISKGKLYRLMSVIEHRGNAFAGHYQTYRRVRSGDAGRWVLISDQNITPIRWRDVRSSQAYMLFYESLQRRLCEFCQSALIISAICLRSLPMKANL